MQSMGPETAVLLEGWLKSLLGSSATAPAIGSLNWAGVGAVLIGRRTQFV